MDNPYDNILQGKSVKDVMLAMAKLSDFELEKLALSVPAERITDLSEAVLSVCQTTDVQSLLILGGHLELYAIASREDTEPSLFIEMYERLGISRSYAYDCRAVWRCFGRALTNEKELAKRFVATSLKILSAKSVSSTARDEAIKLARSGADIGIAQAKEIRKKHASLGGNAELASQAEENESRQGNGVIATLAGNVAKAMRVYTGRLVNITLKSSATSDVGNLDAVITDLQDAITTLQRRKRDLRTQTMAGV